MYDLNLSEAWVPAQADMQIYHVAIGELLRTIAADRPNADALVGYHTLRGVREPLELFGLVT